MKQYIFYFLICFCIRLTGQDTSYVLTADEFMEVVKKYHPVARQAYLIPQQALAELRLAQGGWDPTVYSDYNRKSYDGKNYYSYFENSVKIPVWYGLEVKAGYDFVYGNNLNPEALLPDDGLGYLGVSMPLIKNLFIDKQRAALRQAQIFREASEQQRIIMLNDLLMQALTAYYEWAYSYYELQIYTNAVEVARFRFEATKNAARLGDRPYIDTTEALTQLQSRQLQQNDARLRFIQTSLDIANYLWLENGQPRPYDSRLVPAPLTSSYLQTDIPLSKADELEAQLRQSHPELLNYRFKLQQLDIERRLKIENLKPALNANYNLLSERFNFRSDAGIVFTNNYKFGINFYMPLAFVQGRAEYRLAKLKIQQTQYELDLKTQQLVNKLRAYYNELAILQEQTRIYEQSVSGFKQLFDGETIRFQNGESSLFLVNARENRYLESLVKLRELQAKFYKTDASLRWTLGVLGAQ
ncbi:MAG: TolC family protein [Chitinophagales bacterium]|nr:TolC family protein [Chitinophagales bacterium]MDW8418464.1 TolC family protein [Chitinophagales bacterium]